MLPTKYESQKRGPTAQAMANMKNEAKNNYEFTQLIQDLYKLRIEPLSKDEQLATDNMLERKCFGYQHFVNIADEINIICFTEGSFDGYPPLPVAEYITHDHTKDSLLKSNPG